MVVKLFGQWRGGGITPLDRARVPKRRRADTEVLHLVLERFSVVTRAAFPGKTGLRFVDERPEKSLAHRGRERSRGSLAQGRRGITWGLSHFTTAGTRETRHSLLARIGCDLSQDTSDETMKRTDVELPPDAYFSQSLTNAQRRRIEAEAMAHLNHRHTLD